MGLSWFSTCSVGSASTLLLRSIITLHPYPCSVRHRLLTAWGISIPQQPWGRDLWETQKVQNEQPMLWYSVSAPEPQNQWGRSARKTGTIYSYGHAHVCVRRRNAAAPSLTLHLLNVCAGARGQGTLLAALMAFRPPQVSRKTCNVLARPLQTPSSHVIEWVHCTI